jgi:two-component system response regulator AtoC
MAGLAEHIRAVASSDYDVLVTGESGTGKELVARAVHRLSARREGPFVAVACAALPETLLEDELFGHERGAFTDARERRRGRFEEAHGGTIFLDDIDDAGLGVQVKLLRVLQERRFQRLGGAKTVEADFRVVAATKADLKALASEGRFREDLFYRLNVVPVLVPPLRARPEDVPLLTEHFIRLHGGGRKLRVETSTYEAMAVYDWPGNVRELENAVKRAIALSGGSGVLAREHLVPAGRGDGHADGPVLPLKDHLAAAEKEHVRRVLASVAGSRTRAAELLGISRKSLWEKMKAHDLT